MIIIIVGIILIAFAVVSVIPGCLGWGAYVLSFLKGGVPVMAAFIGLISLFIGAADIKDKREALKEEKAAREQYAQEKK